MIRLKSLKSFLDDGKPEVMVADIGFDHRGLDVLVDVVDGFDDIVRGGLVGCVRDGDVRAAIPGKGERDAFADASSASCAVVVILR